jgi:alpha-L-rhamnosidase
MPIPPAAGVGVGGDAICVVPTVLHERFGNLTAIRRCYEGMKRWVDIVHQRAGETLLWETGQQFGDWLDPDAPPDRPGDAKADPDIVATAYFARSAALTAHAAALLGEHRDAQRTRNSPIRSPAPFAMPT